MHVIQADGDLTVKMKLHFLKIMDELQGCLSMTPHYLAVSVLKDEISTSSGSFDSHGKDASVGYAEDDDSFMDALSDFMCQTEAGNYLQNKNFDQQGLTGIASDLESGKTFLQEKEIEKGKGIPLEVYYEAEGSDHSDFISVTFSTRSSVSLDYDGIDTQVHNLRIVNNEIEYGQLL